MLRIPCLFHVSPPLAGFDSLTALMLGSNQLSSWEAACQLDRFPSLRDARLSDNPITAAAPSTARYQCIARIRWVKFGAGLPFGLGRLCRFAVHASAAAASLAPLVQAEFWLPYPQLAAACCPFCRCCSFTCLQPAHQPERQRGERC